MASARSKSRPARVLAGIPATNSAIYHRIRFLVGDPVACLEIPIGEDRYERTLILRDIEMERARRVARADRVFSPLDFVPAKGLSGDRENALAQAMVECLRRARVSRVVGDRTLPLIYSEHLRQAGILVEFDAQLGVLERRSKDGHELEWLRGAQRVTEQAMEMACGVVANAVPRRDGVLIHDGEPLTSERMRTLIDNFLLQAGYENPPSIVVGGPAGADCHDLGATELRSGEPVIIDIFPRSKRTRYNGDCTRTVVHGEIPDEVQRMHDAVLAAKVAAMRVTRAGSTGEEVHRAAVDVIRSRGYSLGLQGLAEPPAYCAMTHGTGHGVGLDVHEPPLLDLGGPELVVGDVLTIEPGLYCRKIGGVRVEDMVFVLEDGCENVNDLPGGLTWR